MYSDKTNQNNSIAKNIVLIIIVIGLAVWPLATLKGAEFGGADGQAEAAINEINPDYKPWFSSLYEPASGEIESMLFALQAAIGAGIIGYCLGYMKGRSRKEQKIDHAEHR